jgi:hypothetical protein
VATSFIGNRCPSLSTLLQWMMGLTTQPFSV